jgi:23S rRNA pseudouridine2605 synthase
MGHNRATGGGGVPLARALSKLGFLSRARAVEAIRAGRVRVDGAVVTSPARRIEPRRARIEIDGAPPPPVAWRTILFHKPRGVLTTRRDPGGRKTVFDVLGKAASGLVAVGRLDLATSGLLLLTTDTALADRITDPARGVVRTYAVTVRGRPGAGDLAALCAGVVSGRERLRARSVALRKASGRESHLIVELDEGKNRELRRLFEAIGHEVTRLKRVGLGPLSLGDLQPGEWREMTREEVGVAFPAPKQDRPV